MLKFIYSGTPAVVCTVKAASFRGFALFVVVLMEFHTLFLCLLNRVGHKINTHLWKVLCLSV